ncbi:MAG: DUF1877 family protein [Anaeromyxobacteraceae bacterium]
MTGRGYLFALDPAEVRLALGCMTSGDLGALLAGWRGGALTAELDKAWLTIDRCLGAGGKSGASAALLGGIPVVRARDVIASLIPADQVVEVARVLEGLDLDTFRDCFEASLTGEPDGESEELDLLYAWGWFQRLRGLYRAAAAARRAVLFAGELRPGSWPSNAAA